MQADQSRFVTVLGGEGDAAKSEANFASKKALKHFRTTIYIKIPFNALTRYIKFQLKHKLINFKNITISIIFKQLNIFHGLSKQNLH